MSFNFCQVNNLADLRASEIGIRLAWRRCVNGVKRSNELRVECKRVSLNELKRIMRLRINIHADNLESCSAVTDTRTASATEKIKHPGLPCWHANDSCPCRDYSFTPLFPPSARKTPKGRQVSDTPEPIPDACGHRGSYAQCTMNLSEIVGEIIKDNKGQSPPRLNLLLNNLSPRLLRLRTAAVLDFYIDIDQ